MTELAEIVAGWPLAASIAAAATARGLRAGRRRTALNEALHELRRPLHSIALATRAGAAPRIESSVQLAAAALERLDCEINGGTQERAMEVVPARPLLESAVRRWKARASIGGGSLILRWHAGAALVEVDGFGLAQALDNLIVNAIEHGGPSIAIEARLWGERVRVSVTDSGWASRPATHRGTPAGVVARLAGRRRHGHGLTVVRQVAAAHGGRFALRRTECGTRAVLELPLAKDLAGSAA